jgi:hypothetical protein
MTWERLRRAAVARALGFDLRNDQVTHVHVQYEIILVHPGLDLVISAHNASEPAALWAAIRPAVVALDPQFKGDATGFCEAYGAGKYAPDLLAPRIAPSN